MSSPCPASLIGMSTCTQICHPRLIAPIRPKTKLGRRIQAQLEISNRGRKSVIAASQPEQKFRKIASCQQKCQQSKNYMQKLFLRSSSACTNRRSLRSAQRARPHARSLPPGPQGAVLGAGARTSGPRGGANLRPASYTCRRPPQCLNVSGAHVHCQSRRPDRLLIARILIATFVPFRITARCFAGRPAARHARHRGGSMEIA